MKIMRVKQQDGTLVDIPMGVDTASSAVSTHNANTSAHADIREQISQLSSEKVDKSNIFLGIASDGLMHIFVDGEPVGSGVARGGGDDVFGYVDENNVVVLSGNLPTGAYTIKYEMTDGSLVHIGNLALDNNVYYTVQNILTNCTTNNSTLRVLEGQSYSATITANDGYELSSVSVTMGGSPVTVTNGNINIASVTGDIVITAVATEAASATNFADPTSSDWIADGRIRRNGQATTGAGDGAYASNYVSCQNGDIVLIKNASLDTFNHGFYDSSKTKVQCPNFADAQSNSYITNVSSSGAETQFTINVANTSYMRFSLTNVTDVNTVVINIKRNGEWL